MLSVVAPKDTSFRIMTFSIKGFIATPIINTTQQNVILSVKFFIIMLTVVTLNVVTLSVVAPSVTQNNNFKIDYQYSLKTFSNPSANVSACASLLN
jgi:hypothetical protein